MNELTTQHQELSVSANAQMAKAVQEIQAALVIAKKFPRDEDAAIKKIMKACQRQTLAEDALYAYKRGDELVTGPSIRLAEVLAQSWGNIDFGVRELEQRDGASLAQTYCWDMETNTRQTKEFTVPHKRFTKSGSYALKDPRDIYELVANYGARRMRACILGIIPGDVVDAAVKEINKTLAKGNGEPLADRIQKMETTFNSMDVTKAMLEKHLGHKLEATTETEIVKLQAVYRSIRDGFSTKDQYFGAPSVSAESDKGAAVDAMLSSSAEQSPKTS